MVKKDFIHKCLRNAHENVGHLQHKYQFSVSFLFHNKFNEKLGNNAKLGRNERERAIERIIYTILNVFSLQELRRSTKKST